MNSPPPGARSVSDHLAEVLGMASAPLPVRRVPIADALGCVLAEPLVAGVDLPLFDNSAMDGYAVRAADVASTPVTLPVTAHLAATARTGDLDPLAPHTAQRIMTGAQLPPGADAVVRVEWTDAGARTVRVDQAVPAGAEIRRVGEDVVAGDTVLDAGQVLGPAQIGLAAALGNAELTVHRRPRVAVLGTGSELVEPGSGDPLASGAIYDSNSFAMYALAQRFDAQGVRLPPIADDDIVRARSALDLAAQQADLIVTSGGVSAGENEIIKDVFAGSRDVGFVKVAMQPGKPQGLGHYRGIPILTFPGNPVSTFVSFVLFAAPLIRKLAGHRNPQPQWQQSRLAEDVQLRPGVEVFLRGRLDPGTHVVSANRGRGSHLLAGLAESDCLIAVPAGSACLPAGSRVRVLPLP